MIDEYCEKYLGYRHLSGARAYCGEDVCTHIIYCEKCKKKNKKVEDANTKHGGKGE